MKKFLFIILIAPLISHADNSVMIVEFTKKPTLNQISQIQNLKGVKSFIKLSPYKSDYFDRTYELHTDSLDENSNDSLAFKVKQTGLTNRVEEAKPFELFEIIPTKEKSTVTQDDMFNYQWNLRNNGQTVTNDNDDTHPEPLTGLHDFDFGWTQYYQNYEPKIKKELKVAVIDSGTKTSHPELKPQIFRNLIECNKGKEPDPTAKEDRDNNGYIGDCMGYDFSDPEKPKGSNIASNDELGHGTANSGIMAASINERGIAGISNKIKVIPIKIISKKELKPEKDPVTCALIPQGGNPYSSFVHNVAKGILYAITMKADVINLSLGWPDSANTKEVQEALAEAHKNNIIVVSAAGNNGNNSPVYPCINKNVICVGGTMANGKMSYRSNYGGFVDTVAPGNNILTLTSIPSPNFVNGYGISSGTSQAAPHISALIAILKGIYPNITPDEIRARIFASGGQIKDTKNVLSGQPKLDKAIEVQPQVVLRPIFKEQSTIYYDLEATSGLFSFEFPIKNYWSKANDVEVQVQSLNQNVKFSKTTFKIGSMNEGQEVVLKLSGQLLDTYLSRDLDISVEIFENKKSLGKNQNHYYLSRNLNNDPKVRQIQFAKSAADLNQTRTVPTYFNNYSMPEYYVRELVKENDISGIQLSLFNFQDSKYVHTKSIFLENATSLLILLKVDLNYDGKPDYLVSYVNKNCSTSKFYLKYLDSNLKPLNNLPSTIEIVEPTGFLSDLSAGTLRFVKANLAKHGDIAVPIFFDKGTMSPEDQSKKPSEIVKTDSSRIYYYEPIFEPELQFRVRSYVNYKLIEKLQNDLPVYTRDGLALVGMLPQSEADFMDGKVSLMISWTKDRKLRQSLLNLNYDLIQNKDFKLQHLDLRIPGIEYYKYSEAINLDQQKPGLKSNFTFSAALTTKSANTFLFQFLNSVPQLKYVFDTIPFEIKNTFVGADNLIKTFIKNQTSYSFFNTNNKIILRVFDDKSDKQFEQDVIRTSFYLLFSSENLMPVVRGEDEKLPAIYVDASAISSRHVFIWTYHNDTLVAPALMNVHIPSNCRAMYPNTFSEKFQMSYSVFCKDGDQHSIRTLPIE